VLYDVTISATEGGIVTPQSGTFEEGSSVTLTATPSAEYEFAKWSNGSTENPLVFTVTSDLSIQATFIKKQYELTISKEGEGTVNEKVINTGKGYDSGTKIELTAVPAGEWVFAGWSGDVTSTENPLQVTISSPKNIKAKFVKRKYPLTINIEGQGTVTEEIVSAGRTTEYDSGTTVRLTAQASEGWEFIEWRGDVNSNEYILTINLNKSITTTAIFIEKQPNNRIVLDFYDIPEDQDFDHVFFSLSPGWNQFNNLDEKMFKKIILYNQNDQVISEKTYKPGDNIQIDLPVPTNNFAHYLREYLYYDDENNSQGNKLLDNFLGDFDLFNFRFQYELIFTTPVFSDTKIEYEIKHQNDALLLVDKNIPVIRVGVGTTGFAPGGRHIYVNSKYDSYPIRLYFDSYYIDKIVNTTKDSTTIIELSDNDITYDYPVGSTDEWINDPIYSPLKIKFDKGESISYSDYINAFKLEAQTHNINLDLTPVILTRSNLYFDGVDYLAYTEDVCTQPKIYLTTSFTELNFGQQVAVIFHEFGHAYFRYDHEDFGLMLPNVSISQYRNYTALKSDLARFFNQLNHKKINCSSTSNKSLNIREGQKLNKIFFKL
jgi:hypothetical protein